MSKPPATPPHSDTDGVHQDQVDIVDVANRAGQDAGDLERARKDSAGRPRPSGGDSGADDRSS